MSEQTMSWLAGFARRCSLIFGLLTPIACLVTWIVMELEAEDKITYEAFAGSGVPRVYVEYVGYFTLGHLLFALVALTASIGLLRLQSWAHRTWLVLLAVGLMWAALVAVYEIHYLLRALPSGTAPPDADRLGVIGLIVVASTVALVSATLLWRLTRPDVWEELE